MNSASGCRTNIHFVFKDAGRPGIKWKSMRSSKEDGRIPQKVAPISRQRLPLPSDSNSSTSSKGLRAKKPSNVGPKRSYRTSDYAHYSQLSLTSVFGSIHTKLFACIIKMKRLVLSETRIKNMHMYICMYTCI